MGHRDRAVGKGCAVIATLVTAAVGSCTASLLFLSPGARPKPRPDVQPQTAQVIATATATISAKPGNGRIGIGPAPEERSQERSDPRWQHYRAIGPAAREKALRNACPGGRCNPQLTRLIIAAADTPIEAASLRNVIMAMEYTASEPARERQRQAASARERAAPAESEVGRVCCCDGTVSPSCTTVHRGCCSRHGGVCACR
ncbi:hypothetical protein ACSRUE_42030 [Sorangium sp. KYC3313]|uniref:hypothetical protein n=1 Tax=Sorangium sp. KYC3313 TaxID=3449740 RepID=UPI003F886A3C